MSESFDSMKANFEPYIETINALEQVEEIVIQSPRYRKCCHSVLELLKVLLKKFKNKHI